MEAKLDFKTLKELGKNISRSNGDAREKHFTQLRMIHSEELEPGLQFYIQYLHGMYWRAKWHGTNDVMDLENANLHFDNIHLLALKHRSFPKDWKYFYYRADTKLELIRYAIIPEDVEGLKVVIKDTVRKGLLVNGENEKLIALRVRIGGSRD